MHKRQKTLELRTVVPAQPGWAVYFVWKDHDGIYFDGDPRPVIAWLIEQTAWDDESTFITSTGITLNIQRVDDHYGRLYVTSQGKFVSDEDESYPDLAAWQAYIREVYATSRDMAEADK